MPLARSAAAGLLALAHVFVLGACASGPRVREIESFGRRGQAGPLLERLADPRSWVREEAARVLGAYRMAVARAPLLVLAQAPDERRYVRAAAVRALGRIGDPEDRPVLEAVAGVPGMAPELKLALVGALCRLAPTAGTYQVLQTFAADEDLLVSAAATTEIERKCAR